MKDILFFTLLFNISVTFVSAQNRVSIAPTFWLGFNPYSYQMNYTYNGSTTQTPTPGYKILSAFGLMASYHFTPQWDFSVGALYSQNTNYLTKPKGPYGNFTPFTDESWQLPILVSYRLSDKRLAPYFSTGTIFARNRTFTERPITTDWVVGVGLNYRINSTLSLLFQPTASYSFYRPTDDAFYTFTNYKSYGLGIRTQVIWYF